MEDNSRQQMLRDINRRLCRTKLLDYNIIEDLLLQLQSITKPIGKEEQALLKIVRLSKKELKKYNKAGSQSEKISILRKVLRNITNDIEKHILNYFSE